MNLVTKQEMQDVYDAMKTPYKKGPVLWEYGVNIDCATIFRLENEWRMIYARQDPRVDPDKQGYETWMAASHDLLHWNPMGRLLAQRFEGWDGLQCDGGILLVDPTWQGSLSPTTFAGRYWMSYIGGALPGYEPDPLHMGMAHNMQLDTAQEWQRLPSPILHMDDSDVRDFERVTLYKSTVIRDETESLGASFVMYYNAKQENNGIEEIGIAISSDMTNWKRYGKTSVVQSGVPKNEWSIAGDPQIIRYKNLWVMHYFVAYTDPSKGAQAYDTFAVSKNLTDWTRWDGQPLIEPSIPEDATFAHKPYVFCYNDVVYHFYCAVGSKGRCLALATSSQT